ALARSAAFLRCRYALRRLRLACTRCCCPMGKVYRLKQRETQSGFDRGFSCSKHELEIRIAFLCDSFKKGTLLMTHRESAASSSMPKSVAGLTILLLVVGAFFGFLNGQKVKALRATVATSQAARDAAELRAREKLSASTGAAVTKEEQGKVAEA